MTELQRVDRVYSYLLLKCFVFVCILFFSSKLSYSQTKFNANNGLGIGYQLVQYQNDFGFGLNVITPYFADENMAIRLKGNLMFNQNILDGITTWLPYSNVSLGLIGVAGQASEKIRLYGEGGIIAVMPQQKFSSKSLTFGGYGLFGFEFFFGEMGNYFIEIGGVGIGATADKVPTEPIFSNGLSISTGVRFFLQ